MGKIDSFVSFLEKIANDDSHGYAQDHRYGPDYDCSSFVAAGLIHAGFSVSKYSTTRTLAEQLLDNSFKSIDISAPRKRGDIFLNTGVHVVTCTDSDNIVHASINEYGGIVNGQAGDQTGKEICIIPFSSLGMKFDKHFRYSDNFDAISDNAFPVGSVCELLYNLNVRTGPSTQYRKKNHDELTKDGQKHDKNCNGSLDKGTEVSILATVLDADGNLWAQIPSGWICAREGGENYLKCL